MHTVTLLLKTTAYDEQVIERRFRAVSHIHNVCVKHAIKLLTRLGHDHEYQECRDAYLELRKKDALTKDEKARMDGLSRKMADIRKNYGLTKAGLESYIKVCGKRYRKLLSSQQAQKEADRVWAGVEKCLFGKGKKLHFKKHSDFTTIEGKSNTNGAKFIKEETRLDWMGLSIPCLLPKNRKSRDYILESMSGRKVSYCTVKRMMFQGGWRYYVVLCLDGDAPKKERDAARGTAGIDPGVSTAAVVSDNSVMLEELSPGCKGYNRRIKSLLTRMDQSRRASNPGKYKEDGTVKKGDRSPWVYTNSYQGKRRKLKALYRKKAAETRRSHGEFCNRIVKENQYVLVEKMNYPALQKRSKKTERREKPERVKLKNGKTRNVYKYKRRKRFGRSINDRSPGLFLRLLEQKCAASGGVYAEVNTSVFRASQYDHTTGKRAKSSLSERWKDIGEARVQRDLYSAFLIRNADGGLEHPDRDKCNAEFAHFVEMHDETIEKMKADGKSMKQCFGF